MRICLTLLILFLCVGAQAADTVKHPNNLGVEVHFGYPSVKLTNPDGSTAFYEGLSVRGGLNVPIFKRKKFELHFNPGAKYLDLENTANDSSQYESGNIIGVGAGLSARVYRFWFGTRYMHLWGRNFASGDFSDRVSYQMSTTEYFGGLYFQFDRLGLGLSYSQAAGKIPKGDTGLNSDTPYNEGIYSLQITFDMGQSLWQILGRLF